MGVCLPGDAKGILLTIFQVLDSGDYQVYEDPVVELGEVREWDCFDRRHQK